jgi:hypothetical protein
MKAEDVQPGDVIRFTAPRIPTPDVQPWQVGVRPGGIVANPTSLPVTSKVTLVDRATIYGQDYTVLHTEAKITHYVPLGGRVARPSLP